MFSFPLIHLYTHSRLNTNYVAWPSHGSAPVSALLDDPNVDVRCFAAGAMGHLMAAINMALRQPTPAARHSVVFMPPGDAPSPVRRESLPAVSPARRDTAPALSPPKPMPHGATPGPAVRHGLQPMMSPACREYVLRVLRMAVTDRSPAVREFILRSVVYCMLLSFLWSYFPHACTVTAIGVCEACLPRLMCRAIIGCRELDDVLSQPVFLDALFTAAADVNSLVRQLAHGAVALHMTYIPTAVLRKPHVQCVSGCCSRTTTRWWARSCTARSSRCWACSRSRRPRRTSCCSPALPVLPPPSCASPPWLSFWYYQDLFMANDRL